jgi:hypothetical protein
MSTFDKVFFKITDIICYALITFFVVLTWIYGIENIKRLGKMLEEKSK